MPRFKARNCEACGGLLSMHPQTLKECAGELEYAPADTRPVVAVSHDDDEFRRFYGPQGTESAAYRIAGYEW